VILSVIFFVSSTCVNVHLSFILASFIYYLLLDGTQCRPIVVIDSGVIFQRSITGHCCIECRTCNADWLLAYSMRSSRNSTVSHRVIIVNKAEIQTNMNVSVALRRSHFGPTKNWAYIHSETVCESVRIIQV